MVKLIALYKHPADPKEFDTHYETIHLPLVRRMPGLRRVEVTRIANPQPGGEKFYLMAEMYFDSRDAMNAAIASREGKAVSKDVVSFARDIVTVMEGEVKE